MHFVTLLKYFLKTRVFVHNSQAYYETGQVCIQYAYASNLKMGRTKQVDVLSSKNQALCKLNQCYCNGNINDVTGKSREQGLIIKEHTAMHTNLILLFKPALILQHFSDKTF